jgi:hypothetical protein
MNGIGIVSAFVSNCCKCVRQTKVETMSHGAPAADGGSGPAGASQAAAAFSHVLPVPGPPDTPNVIGAPVEISSPPHRVPRPMHYGQADPGAARAASASVAPAEADTCLTVVNLAGDSLHILVAFPATGRAIKQQIADINETSVESITLINSSGLIIDDTDEFSALDYGTGTLENISMVVTIPTKLLALQIAYTWVDNSTKGDGVLPNGRVRAIADLRPYMDAWDNVASANLQCRYLRQNLRQT